MIVVAIISILATIAVPTYQDRMVQAQIQEALVLAETLQPTLAWNIKAPPIIDATARRDMTLLVGAGVNDG